MNWFANKGQIVQIVIALGQFALGVAVLILGLRSAFPAMSSGNFFSSGAILFYLLAVLVFVSTGVSMWFSLRKKGESIPGQAKFLPTKAEAGSQQTIPILAFVVEESWLDRTPGAKFPLKLRTKWINEGDEVHVGKPQWIAEKMPLQGNALRYKFKVGSNGTECDETSIKHGEQCEIWLGLNPGIEQWQVEDWRKAHQLGVLILPVTVGRMTKELRVRL